MADTTADIPDITDIPGDIVRDILRLAKLDIDTRRALRVEPGRLTEEPAYGPVRERLRTMHARRTAAWLLNETYRKQDPLCSGALEYLRTPSIATGQRRSMALSINVFGPDVGDGDVRMSIEAIETVDDAMAFIRRGTYCYMQTGAPCPKIFDDSDDDDDDE